MFYDKIMNDSESRHTEQSKYALKIPNQKQKQTDPK